MVFSIDWYYAAISLVDGNGFCKESKDKSGLFHINDYFINLTFSRKLLTDVELISIFKVETHFLV